MKVIFQSLLFYLLFSVWSDASIDLHSLFMVDRLLELFRDFLTLVGHTVQVKIAGVQKPIRLK